MSDPWLPRSEEEVIEGFAVAFESYVSAFGTSVIVRRWGERVDVLRLGLKAQRIDARLQRPEDPSEKFPLGRLPRFTVKFYGDRWMNLDFHRASGRGWRFDWGREGRLAGGTPASTLIELAEHTLSTMPKERSSDDRVALDGLWLPHLLRGPREV